MESYEGWTNAKLKDLLKSRGLFTSGVKDDLVRRLLEQDKKVKNPASDRDVEAQGIIKASKRSTRSSPGVKNREPLAAQGITLKTYDESHSDEYSDSTMVQQLYKLVWYSRRITTGEFGTEPQSKSDQGDFESKAGRYYDGRLEYRAAMIAIECQRTKMSDRSEQEWVTCLLPMVFRSFNQSYDNVGNTEQPEDSPDNTKQSAHHCLACRRDFPPNSRPMMRPTKRTPIDPKAVKRGDIKFCTSTDRHFNLANCDSQMQLQYHNEEDGSIIKGCQIPDITFGLCTYNLEERYWTADWRLNDMVKLFDQKTLKETMNHFAQLKEPYRTNPTSVGIYSYPMFAFGLWEAKKENGDSHAKALQQTAPKLKSLLCWQRKIFDASEVRITSPTVWFFSSVGADWKVYGCSEIKNLNGEGCSYPVVDLWHGNLKTTEDALGLLSIVDLIRFWVDYTYKPLIGTCISRLKAKSAGIDPIPLDSTLWRLRIPMDTEKTPWFFRQRHMKVPSNLNLPTQNLEVSHHGHHINPSRSSRQSLRPEPQSSPPKVNRSPTPAEEHFVMPERDNFNWLLDRDPGGEDLILIRVGETGKILRPVIIHSTSLLVGRKQMKSVYWKDDDFNAVIADEQRGHRSMVKAIFSTDRYGHDYLWQCYRSEKKCIHRPVQFSMVVPIKLASYDQQKPESQDIQLFEPLESIFQLRNLLVNIQRAEKKWCICGRVRNEYSPPMIQCRNALCDISWFHEECVDFSYTNDEVSWLCDKCAKKPKQKRAYIEVKTSKENAFARASHDRTHLARAIEKVWPKHDWPSPDEITAKMGQIADNVDIVESATFTIRETGVSRNPYLPRYWAISKRNPRKLILACSRKEERLYHEVVSDDEDEKDIDDEEDVECETEDNIGDDDDEKDIDNKKDIECETEDNIGEDDEDGDEKDTDNKEDVKCETEDNRGEDEEDGDEKDIDDEENVECETEDNRGEDEEDGDEKDTDNKEDVKCETEDNRGEDEEDGDEKDIDDEENVECETEDNRGEDDEDGDEKDIDDEENVESETEDNRGEDEEDGDEKDTDYVENVEYETEDDED